ncbi:MAG: ABC transporter permease [Oscillospiraceae bacterium]|nr:ABC transporter permease [Oscillospiraceae bacterium]MDD7278382.1 ABC transporter permease [Oscillospiraceae bacterium]MDY2863308.1 ABC transporter permease [Oscillospiraceae bacterium]
MNRMLLYPRLAVNGINKNRRIYLPYILTCSGMIMMYYITSFLTVSQFVREMKGGDIMQQLLFLGCGVMIVFSAVFLFYTNSFIIRRRKTEFGLYNILGMDKRNISRILLWETLMIFVISVVVGISCGILFSKLAELALTKMLGGAASYTFNAEPRSIIHALVYYAVIFLLILINSLRQIHLANPIELMKSENSGEKPPKANYVLAVMGALILAAAYFMAVYIKEPLSAIFSFFVAVLMVIAATYLLFISGSVAVCRVLQKNKNYYYKTNHFISVSQMAYRMKRNGAGLASICILSTMVLVTLSSTICLYIGEEDMLRDLYPRNIIIDTYSVEEDMTSLTRKAANDALEKYGETPENVLHYSYLNITGGFFNDRVILDSNRINELESSFNPDIRQIFFLSLADYNKLTGRNETLSENEAIIYTAKDQYNYSSITLDEYGTFEIKERAEDFADCGTDAMISIPSVYIFVKDEAVLQELYELQLGLYGEYHSMMHDYFGFDLDCDEDKQIEINAEIFENIKKLKAENPDIWSGVSLNCAASDKADFYAMYGGLFFLGILLGSVFIAAAVLIMYYKQISEGFEDKAKFEILQKVGMSKGEIRKSINSQVLTVFFAPLAAAGVHMAFAFGIISRLLMLFGLTDAGLFAVVTLCCFMLFGILYTAFYFITSGTYYKIVSGRE